MKEYNFYIGMIPFNCIVYEKEDIEEDIKEYNEELKHIEVPYDLLSKPVHFECIDLISEYNSHRERSNLII